MYSITPSSFKTFPKSREIYIFSDLDSIAFYIASVHKIYGNF